MSASESLFCFASNKTDYHPCPNCRAPMLVRINPAGVDLSVRTFKCFNCDNVVTIQGDQVGAISVRAGERILDRLSAHPKQNAKPVLVI
jgi:hypothetical protein